MLQKVDELGYAWRQFCRELIDIYRLLVLFRVVDDLAEIAEATPDELQELKTLADLGPLEDHQRALSLLIKSEAEVAISAFPRLLVEMALVRLASLPAGRDVSALVRKLEELERRLASGGSALPATPVASPQPPPDRAVSDPPKKPEAPLPVETSEKGWAGLVDFVKSKRRPRIASILEQVSPLASGDGVLKVGLVQNSFVDGQLDGETRELLQELAAGYYGTPIKLETTYIEEGAAQTAPSLANQRKNEESDRQKRLRDDALNHPIVKTAIEIFEGEVSEVKPIDKGYV
ncbi:MAG: hypothetical protein C0615_08845 [Desulfuromonas sp.]|nr:MAG: hypothetical protein C0615_08845 [Desulfuromonas sp.]